MATNRRQFLQTTALGAGVMALTPSLDPLLAARPSERVAGLQSFYTSPVWAETGSEAVSMLAGRARHVHFLEPVSSEDGFAASASRPLLASENAPGDQRGVLVAAVFLVEEEIEPLVDAVRSTVIPAFEAAGGSRLGLFRSSAEPNNFPILPFIEDETVVVLFASFENTIAADRLGFIEVICRDCWQSNEQT